MQLLKRHADIFSSVLNEHGIQFTPKMLKERSTLLEFLPEHETLKPLQTIEEVVR